MPFSKSRGCVFFIPGTEMDQVLSGTEWALAICLKTLLEGNPSSFLPSDVIVKETDAQREDGVSQ